VSQNGNKPLSDSKEGKLLKLREKIEKSGKYLDNLVSPKTNFSIAMNLLGFEGSIDYYVYEYLTLGSYYAKIRMELIKEYKELKLELGE